MTHPYYAQQSKPPQRWKLYAPFIAFALAVILYTIYWFYAAGQIKSGAEAWIEEQRSYGYTIEHEGLSVGGYPLRLNLIARTPYIQAPEAEGGWALQYEQFSANALPYNFNHWIAGLVGQGTFSVNGQSFGVAAERSRISIVTKQGQLTELGAEILALNIESQNAAPFPIQSLTRLELSSEVDDEGGLQTRMQLEGLSLNDLSSEPSLLTSLGTQISQLRFDTRLTHSQLLIDEANPQSWQATGGQLDIAMVQLEWGDIRVGAQGHLSLDDLARPEGRLSVLVDDPNAVIDALVEARQLTRDQGDAMRLASLMAPRREGGITLPLRLQNGAVFWGPARLGTLDPLY